MKLSGVLLSICSSVCLSVCPSRHSPSRHSPAARRCGGFAAGCPTGRRHQSIAASRVPSGIVHSGTAHSSKCEQCHVYSRRRRLDTDLFVSMLD